MTWLYLRTTTGSAILAAVVLGLAPSLTAQATRSDTTVRMASAPRYPGGGTVTKVLTIGDPNGADEYVFVSITDVVIAKDGRIWILDVPGGMGTSSMPPVLRQYDATGKFIRAVGRRGQGPGEYLGPTGLAQMPDGRIILRDITGSRVNVYTSEGRVDTTWTLVTTYPWPIRGRDALRVDASGIVWMPFSIRVPGASIATRSPTAFLRFRANGQIIDTVATPTLPEVSRASITITQVGPSGGRSTTTLGPPFQPVATWFWHPNGHFVTAVTSRYAVDMRVPPRASAGTVPLPWSDGDPVISIRRTVPAVGVSDAERADYRRYLQADVDRRPGDRSGPVPEVPRTKPPIRNVMAAHDGRIWVSVSTPSERYQPEVPDPSGGFAAAIPPVAWREVEAFDVFEPDGVYLGRVSLPPQTFPRVISGDDVWAMSWDADGAFYLHKYRISWR